MSTLIVRIYATAEQAGAAVAKLKEAGFRDEQVLELVPASARSVASALKAGQMMGHSAGFYAERVEQGRFLVAIDPPFGSGQAATRILDGCGPVDQELEIPADRVTSEWGEGAPLSAALGWQVLSRNPTPLSSALGLNVLATRRTYLTSELSSNAAPLSAMFGLRLLSGNPAPLSSLLGFPLLARRTAKTSSFGMKLLSSNPAPLSSALGMATLSSNPTPLSSALGWQVLSRPS